MARISIASGSTSFPSLTVIRLSNKLSLRNLAASSLNLWALIFEFSYILSHASYILFINPRPRFLARSSIFSKFTFISVVHLWVLFKVVSSSISICAFSLRTFISNSFLNLAALSLKFCFDTRFFPGYCSSHRRFNLNINPVPLLRSSSAVVTSHLFSSSGYFDKGCFV